MSLYGRCVSVSDAAKLRLRAVICRAGGKTHAIASPGPTPLQDHAHAGEIGGGQFYGRYDGRWLQR